MGFFSGFVSINNRPFRASEGTRDLGEVSGSNDGFVSIPTSKQARRQPTVVYYAKRHCAES